MDKATVSILANELHQAEKNRKVIWFLSAQYPDLTVSDAYAIQKAWMESKLAEGRKVIGHKIGLTLEQCSRCRTSMSRTTVSCSTICFTTMERRSQLADSSRRCLRTSSLLFWLSLSRGLTAPSSRF